jgi:hypothetical protein
MAPSARRSAALTGVPSVVKPARIRARRAQEAVVHVHPAADGDLAGIQLRRAGEVHLVVGEGGEQIVRGRHGVDIAGEVQVDPIRWLEPRSAAARAPSRRAACVSPIAHVVLPSPAGVGLMAETSTSFPTSGSARNAASALIFATPLAPGQ